MLGFGLWLGSALILAAAASAQTAAAPGPYTWQRWEHTLTSARQYDNPYADVTLRVRYTGPFEDPGSDLFFLFFFAIRFRPFHAAIGHRRLDCGEHAAGFWRLARRHIHFDSPGTDHADNPAADTAPRTPKKTKK